MVPTSHDLSWALTRLVAIGRQEKHVETAKLLLGSGRLLNSFVSRLLDDVANLKAMLRAISIGTEPCRESREQHTALCRGCMEVAVATIMSRALCMLRRFMGSKILDKRSCCYLGLPILYFTGPPQSAVCCNPTRDIALYELQWALCKMTTDSRFSCPSAAGMETEQFTDFVVGHGELWCAQLVAAACANLGGDARFMDTRDILVSAGLDCRVTCTEQQHSAIQYRSTTIRYCCLAPLCTAANLVVCFGPSRTSPCNPLCTLGN